MKIDIESDGVIGAYLVERGSLEDDVLSPPLDFDTLLFQISLENGESPKQYSGFFSFIHDQGLIAGIRNLTHVDSLLDKTILTFNV